MYEQLTFAGLNKPRDLPTSYRRLMNRHDVDTSDVQAFTDVLTHLHESYGIEWRDLYFDEASSRPNMPPVNHYRALVNPAWEGLEPAMLPGDRKDAVWHIPTTQYTPATPNELWRPLVKAIAKRGDHAHLFGTTRVRRQGGEIHMDLFFSKAGVSGLEDGEEITLGISTGHDYFGNTRLYVDVIAYHDTGDGVGQVMRYLMDPKRRKHTGDAGEEVVSWYDEGLARLETVSDKLYSIVADAMHYEIPIGDMACSVEGFFDHLGLPNNAPSELAQPAGQRAVRTAVGPYTAWHMYKAGMWALEHEYDSRDTSAFKKHVNTVNTLLFNPSLAERRVLKSIEETLEERPDSGHEIWDYIDDEEDREDSLEQVRTRAKSISEGVEEFESTRDRLQTLLTDDGVDEAVPEDEEPLEADA